MKFSMIAPALALLATVPGALATHGIGEKCTKAKYRNTLGCSDDDCSVLKCIPLPNAPGKWYWALQTTCSGIECHNGACNGSFKNAKCKAS